MQKTVHLMRGLPSSGKSYKARMLAGDDGIVCETDAYFVTEVGDDQSSFDFDSNLVPDSKLWNLNRFKDAVKNDCPVIVVDRGNSLSLDSKIFALYAKEFGYDIRLSEPDTPWWQEIRVLLKYKKYNKPILERWALALARMNQQTHQVSAKTIFHWMGRWRYDLTVENILAYVPSGLNLDLLRMKQGPQDSTAAQEYTSREKENRVSGLEDDIVESSEPIQEWKVSKLNKEGEADLINLNEFDCM